MTNKYVFYIYTPTYTPLSSGIRLLYLLCSMLNKIGYEAYVTNFYDGTEFYAPKLTSEVINKHKALGKLQVAIYPEIMMDNPFQSKYVVRWLLNKPNNFLKNWLGDFSEDEFIVHHDDSFRPEWIESHKQFIPHVDRGIFNLKETSIARSGIILYEHRSKINEEFINGLKNSENIYYISSKNPLTPSECAKLYKKAMALVVAERTAAHAEAGLCGCPTIFIENNKFNASYIFDSYWKISSFRKLEPNINQLNAGNGVLLEEFYEKEVKESETNLKLLIENVEAFFNEMGEKTSENTKSILLEVCGKELANKNYKNALKILEMLFSFHKIPNKAYYYYYVIFKELNNFSEADYALNYLKEKIMSYEGGAIFEKFFDNESGNFHL